MSQEKTRSRNHDGFFRYVYSTPKNAKALLNICSKSNGDLERILSGVNLDTLVRLPDTYSEVGERGEADVACLESESPAAAVGAMAMKYAFSPEGFKAAIPNVEAILEKLPSDEQATLVEKFLKRKFKKQRRY